MAIEDSTTKSSEFHDKRLLKIDNWTMHDKGSIFRCLIINDTLISGTNCLYRVSLRMNYNCLRGLTIFIFFRERTLYKYIGNVNSLKLRT